MKRFTIYFVMLGLLLALPLGFIGCKGESDTITVKVATVLPESHPTAKSLAIFKERLEELSKGKMKVDIFYSSALGSADESLRSLQDGTLEVSQVSTATISNYVQLANAFAMPYIWRDREHQYKAMDGEAGQILADKALEEDFVILGYMDAGTRNISTRKQVGPVTKPEEVKGLKIRVMGAPLMTDTFDAFGANPMAINQGEVFTNLQTGVLDGWENNVYTVVTFKMFDTGCIHYSWTKHFSIPDVMVAGKPFMDKLTEQQAEWVRQAMDACVEKQRQLWQEGEEQAIATMKENGMKFHEADVEAFRAKVQPIYDKYSQQYGEEFKQLVDKVRGIK